MSGHQPEAKEAKRHPEPVPAGRVDSTALFVSSYHDLISLDSPGSVLLMISLYLMYTYTIIFIYIYTYIIIIIYISTQVLAKAFNHVGHTP